ncbi:MAG: hypothetical protein MK086_03975 [Flavobacteriales bacterium]|nr:hypothetical protein [Flavobacteriales bacterium]
MKSFFEKHREEFDDQNPPDLWKEIEGKLPEPKKEVKMVPLRVVWRVAAGVAILLSTAWFFNKEVEKPRNLADSKQDTEEENSTPIYPELAEADFYYQTKINQAGEALHNFELSEEELGTIELLEEELDELRETLGSEPDDEQVVEAMIEIYRLKLSLMEDLLYQLQNQHHDKEDISVVPL